MKIQAVLLLAGMGVMEHAVAETPRNPISVHVLNTQTGKPSQGVNVDLEQQQGGKWVRLASKTTDVDGRIPAFILTAKTLPLASIALPSIPVTISTASKRDFLSGRAGELQGDQHSGALPYSSAAEPVRFFHLPRQLIAAGGRSEVSRLIHSVPQKETTAARLYRPCLRHLQAAFPPFHRLSPS